MVTKNDILNKFKQIYESKTHKEKKVEFNSEGVASVSEITVANKLEPEVSEMFESLIEAFLTEIKQKGIDMGDSKATKLEVG